MRLLAAIASVVALAVIGAFVAAAAIGTVAVAGVGSLAIAALTGRRECPRCGAEATEEPGDIELEGCARVRCSRCGWAGLVEA